MKEPDVKIEPVKPDSYRELQTSTPVSLIVTGQPENQSVKKEKSNLLNKPVRDTVPAKKKAARNNKNITAKEFVTKLNEQEQAKKDADATLQEIIQLKNEIGLKKESIGVKKEKLKTADGKEKEKILKELQKERDEVDGKRRELDIKRTKLEILKELTKEKQMEEKRASIKKTIDHENAAVIKKNEVKQRVRSDQREKRIQPDKSNAWDKSNEQDKSDTWDESDQWDKGDEKERDGKKKPVITDPQKKTSTIDKNKWNKQEHEYKINLPQKSSSPAKPAPDNLKTPGVPAKKAQPVKPGTGN